MARKKPMTKVGKRRKFSKVMREFHKGALKSSSGRKVTSRKQAQAIAASESGTTRRKKKRKKSK